MKTYLNKINFIIGDTYRKKIIFLVVLLFIGMFFEILGLGSLLPVLSLIANPENLKDVDLIISHNASFDRPFVDDNSEISKSKIWGCSIKDIDWLKRGFTNVKQELLCFWHGFYFESHRAMNDVSALIHLLTHPSYSTERPLVELINSSEQDSFNIWVTNFPFNAAKKNKIKSKGYNWNTIKKLWFKRVLPEKVEEEKSFLIDLIYLDSFRGLIESIDPINNYKDTFS